jgi:uncharacterized membrane protein YdbT with pleckstrin-like domain
MDLHPGERIVFDGHPSWRAALGFHLAGVLAAVAIGVLVGVLGGTAPGVVAVLVALATVLLAGLLRRLQTRYVVTTQRLRICRGLLSRRVQQTQLQRVRHVNTEQSLLERLLRVGTIDFDTASADGSKFTFHGIAEPDAVMRAVDRAVHEAPHTPWG